MNRDQHPFLNAAFSNIPLKLVFQYFVDLPDESEPEHDSVDEDAQVDYLETPTTPKSRKMTSTPADISPVDLTVKIANYRGQPPVKGKSSPARQA